MEPPARETAETISGVAQTFVVPSEIDPGTLRYNSIGPEGDGLYALYGLDTNPITAVLTGPNGAPGLPGLIIGLRAASFEIFPPGTLSDGTYKVGVACTYFGDTASFWDTLIEVSRDPEDQPAEIRWETTSGASRVASGVATDQNSDSGTVAIVAAAVLAIVAAGVFADSSLPAFAGSSQGDVMIQSSVLRRFARNSCVLAATVCVVMLGIEIGAAVSGRSLPDSNALAAAPGTSASGSVAVSPASACSAGSSLSVPTLRRLSALAIPSPDIGGRR